MSKENSQNKRMEEEEMISKKFAIEQVRMACYHFANLHYWYLRTLWDDLGKEKGSELAAKAIRKFAKDRAMRMRKLADEKGVKVENEDYPLEELFPGDIPVLGWVKELGSYHCPFGAAWLDKRGQDPEACEIGFFYCKANDPIKLNTYSPNYIQVGSKYEGLWDTHICCGDESCDRVHLRVAPKGWKLFKDSTWTNWDTIKKEKTKKKT